MMTVVKTLSEKKLQAFIFDMDGVIIDSEPIHSRVKMETFRHFGIDFDESRLSSYMGGTSGLIFKDVVAESGRTDITPEMLTDYKHKHYLEVLQSGGIDPVEGLTILDALDIETLKETPAQSLIITQVYSQPIASDAKLMLMDLYPDEYEITYIHNLAMADESIRQIPLYELDRQPDLDHLTSLYIRPLAAKKG